MRIIICDDSDSYSLMLKKSITEILDDLSVNAEFEIINNLPALKKYLDGDGADIVFLDIMFGGQSSIDWWTENIVVQNFKVIFMTSYPEEAYNISRISNALFMVKSRTDRDYLEELLLKAISTIAGRSPNIITIKIGNTTHTLKSRDITYIEAQGNSIKIHLAGGGMLRARKTISKFGNDLPPNFLRIHKSYIINMNHVVRTEPHQFVLNNDAVLYVNSRKYKELEDAYLKFINL